MKMKKPIDIQPKALTKEQMKQFMPRIIKDIPSIQMVITGTIKETLTGNIDTKTCSAVMYACSMLLKSIELKEKLNIEDDSNTSIQLIQAS